MSRSSVIISNGEIAGFARIDGSTEALETIEYPHHEIHDGRSFVACDVIQLDDAAAFMYLIVTPNTTRWSHLIIKVAGSLDTEAEFFEGTARVGGNAMVEHNRNRNSANSAGTVVTDTPGAGADGTSIWHVRFGNDAGPGPASGTGGESRGVNEWELKQDESYLLRVTSHSDTNNITVEFDWYEHVDRN
jgi:hypothetical protein